MSSQMEQIQNAQNIKQWMTQNTNQNTNSSLYMSVMKDDKTFLTKSGITNYTDYIPVQQITVGYGNRSSDFSTNTCHNASSSQLQTVLVQIKNPDPAAWKLLQELNAGTTFGKDSIKFLKLANAGASKAELLSIILHNTIIKSMEFLSETVVADDGTYTTPNSINILFSCKAMSLELKPKEQMGTYTGAINLEAGMQ